MQSPVTNSNRCQVKVCGVRDYGESAALDALGVDWIGYNFHPGSARFIAPEAAATLIGALRHAVPVGVFVDADRDEVLRTIAVTGIRFVQLHGNENWEYVASMPVPVIKAIPHDRLADLGGLRDGLSKAKAGTHPLGYFLVDTQTKPSAAEKTVGATGAGSFGGSGKTFDWGLLGRHPLPLPYFLAGGLGPHNLAEALASTSPFAVDLNSKVEVSPGHKDLEKVKACLAIVRAARP
jgi:phosphoribosylanthranilate isomerase